MDSIISVIIPVYNVELYIAQCLESVVQQSYASLEIILIDDGSTDASGQICDAFAVKDDRIRVIHQENAGAAAARNTGLDTATGEYLVFADSDDWLERDAYSYMLEELKKEQADIVQCSYRDIYVNKQIDQICKASGSSYDQVSFLARFTEDWTCGLLWDKLFKREVFKNIRFETGHIIDDEFFTYQGVMNAKKVICRDRIVYNYRMRRSGATGNPEHYEQIVTDKLDYLTKRLDKVTEAYPPLSKTYNRHFLYMMIWLSDDSNITEQGIEQIQTVLRERWKQCRNSGEGWRVDLKLKQLMRSKPHEYLENRTIQYDDKKERYQLFE